MNERIREIVNKAISDVDYIRDDDFTNEELSKMYIPDCFAEKFAELIVRQMLDITDAHTEVFQTDRDKALIEHIKQSVKQHFGVEE